jgi:RecA/RadA recombinase
MLLPPSQTASSLLLSARPPHRFSSACPALDRLLTPKYAAARSQASTGSSGEPESGLGEGEILELLGPQGIGKTRTAMAFAIAERFRVDAGEVLVVGERPPCKRTLPPLNRY